MKKNNHEDVDREKRALKVGIYIRVGSIEQLSNEVEQRRLNLKMESFQKEECNEAVSYEKEKDINYTGPTEIYKYRM